MSPSKKKKEKIRLHADPRKVRRVWTRKPATRIQRSTKRSIVDRLKEREAREEV